jgi:hypothetical protein
MVLLIRAILIGLIIYLLVRSFVRYWENDSIENREQDQESKGNKIKRVSKDVGEFVDYEEIKD